MKKIYFNLVLLSVFLTLTLPFSSTAALDSNAAKNYLTSKPLTPWSIMALESSGSSGLDLSSLKNISGTEAINFASPILAITASGNNPRTFASTDLVQKLKSFYNQGQLGDVNSLNEDAFGLLALISAGEDPNSAMLVSIKNFLLSNQNSNGSWGFAVGNGDTDMTAATILALKAAGVNSTDTKIQNAIEYIKQNQTSEGGFLSSPAYDTVANSASTAWVLWALNAINLNPTDFSKDGKTPIDFLESAQDQNGFIAYTPNASEDSFTTNITAYGLIATNKKYLPLRIVQATQEEYEFRIEGGNKTICQGHTTGPTALDIIKNASVSCGYSYTITDTQYGPYLNKIDSDEGSGLTGWQYAVNLTPGSIGAADYKLKTGDSVLWYFGSWDNKLTKLTLSASEITTGQNATAKIEYNDSGIWKPLENATIFFGTSNINTDPSGQANLSSNDGYYSVFAEKTNFVRSNSILLKIGSPTSNSAVLSATIGQVAGEEEDPVKKGVSFTLNSQDLNFGNLSKGQTIEKTIKITNDGDVNLDINSVVQGDVLFTENLKLQNNNWKNFKTSLSTGENKDIGTKLSVPSNYNGSGTKNGQIIFWAKTQD